MQRLSTRILSFLMAIIMMLSLTTSVFATTPTDPAESNNQTEVSDQTGDENAPSEESLVDPSEIRTDENTSAASQPDPVPVAEAAITVPENQLPRLTTLYEGNRVRYYDSARQPLPENAELFMNEINEDDVPFYLQRAAHSLGLESCGMYLYFIADPLIEDASTAEILKYQANPDDPEDRMTVEITLIDDSKMTDEEKELRLDELQNIHLEDLQVIQLGSYWDYDTILPHSEENGVIRFEIEKIAPFILFIPDWESAVYIPEEPEPADVPEMSEEVIAPTEGTGTQQAPEETLPGNPVDTTENDNPSPDTDVSSSPDEPAASEELTVTASGSDYSVSLTYTADANIPEGAVFELSELPSSGILYDNLMTSVVNTLNTDAESIVSVTFVDVDVKKDGDSVVFAAPVKLSFEVNSASDSAAVTRVVSLGQTSELLDPDESVAGTFTAWVENLSNTYAVVTLNEETIEVETDPYSADDTLTAANVEETPDGDDDAQTVYGSSVVTVKITGHSGTTEYDGDEHSVVGYDVEISNPQYTEEYFTFDGTAEAKRTDAGTTGMGLVPDQFANTNHNFDTVVFVVTDGKLTVSRKPVTVTAKPASKTYGDPDPELTAEIDGLIGEDTIEYTVSRGAGEDVGDYPITVSGDAEQGNYEVAFIHDDVNFSIEKKGLTITAASESKVYDGYELTNEEYTAEGLTEGDWIESVVHDERSNVTDVGSVDNVINSAKIVNVKDEEVTNNYNIELKKGTLEVTKKPITITANSASKVYDGTELRDEGFTSTGLADGDVFDGITVTGSQTLVGESKNVPSDVKIVRPAEDGSIVDVNGNYDITYANGKLTVTKRELTITADSASKVYDGTPLTKETYTVDGLAEGDSIQSVFVVGSQTDVGESENEAFEAKIVNTAGEDVTDYYKINYVNGVLKVTKKPVKLTGNSGVAVCDGNEKTISGFTVSTDDKLLDGITFADTVTASGSGTDIGSYPVTFSGVTLEETTDTTGNYVVTETVNGILQITESAPINKALTSFNGNEASYLIKINPNELQLNGGHDLTLKDTLATYDKDKSPDITNQSIDYSSITISGASVPYDYSGYTGTYTIPDQTAVTITYTTRVSGEAGKKATFSNTAELGAMQNGGFSSWFSATVIDTKTITPTGTDIEGTGGVYAIKLFTYAQNHMEDGLGGAVFRLLDAKQQPIAYRAGEHAGEIVTFTTGENGYVDVALDDGIISLHKNTVYYLEMITAPVEHHEDGTYTYYQKDNTLYSFVITDNPSYSASGGAYAYFNGDVMKVRCYPESAGVNVTKRFSGNYSLTDEQKKQIVFVLQKEDLAAESWVDVETHSFAEFSYGSMNFNIGHAGGPPLEPAVLYRVIEKNTSIPEADCTSSVILNYQRDNKPVQENTNEFEVNPDHSTYSFSLVFDNTYVDHKLTVVKLNELTGVLLTDAEFTVYTAQDDTFVKTYITEGEGVLEIRRDDEGANYAPNTAYYVVETNPPTDYLMPKDPEKVYFYFSENSAGVPEGIPVGTTAVDLTASYDTVVVNNQTETVDVPVTVTWSVDGSNAWPADVASVEVSLYRTVNGVTEPVKRGGNPMTVTLSKDKTFDNTTFVKLPAREDGSDITYSVLQNDLANYYTSYRVSGTGWYVVHNESAVSVTVEKKWYDLDGNLIADAGDKQPVLFDLYRTIEEHADITIRDDLENILRGLEPVKTGLTLSAENGWTNTVTSLQKQDAAGKPYYYFALEREDSMPRNNEDSYAIARASEGSLRTLTVKNTQTPITVIIRSENLEKPYGQDDPDFTFATEVQDDDWTIGEPVKGEGGNYTVTVTKGTETKQITFTCSRKAGEDAGSYAIELAGDASQQGFRVRLDDGTLTITPAQVTVKGTATKIYGDPDPSLVEITGVKEGDTISYYAYRDIGEQKGSYRITVTGLPKQGNYEITYINDYLTIQPAPVTVTANNLSKPYGSPDPALTVTIDGLKNNDATTVIHYTISRDKQRTEEGESVGEYPITVTGDEVQGNYTVTFVNGTFTVTGHKVTVRAKNVSKTYGDADPTWEAEVTGLQPGETLNYTFTRTGGEDVGTYVITPVGETAQGNAEVIYETGFLTINKADMTVTPVNLIKALTDPVTPDPQLTVSFDGMAERDKEIDPSVVYDEGTKTWTYTYTREGKTEPEFGFTITRTPGETAGPYIIAATAFGERSRNYNITYKTGIFTVLTTYNVVVNQQTRDLVDYTRNPEYTYKAVLDPTAIGIEKYNAGGFADNEMTFTLPADGSSSKTMPIPSGAKLTVTQQQTENPDYTTAITLDNKDVAGTSVEIDPVNKAASIVVTHERIVLPVEARAAQRQTSGGEADEDGAVPVEPLAYLGIPRDAEGNPIAQSAEAFIAELDGRGVYNLPEDKYYVPDHASVYNGENLVAKNIYAIRYDAASKVWQYSLNSSDFASFAEGDQLLLFYMPQYICQVQADKEKYYTLNEAINHIRDEYSGTGDIEMLIDRYTMPATDALTIPANYNITLTTADGLETATILRKPNFNTGHMFSNSGALTLGCITLDGNGNRVTAGDAMVLNNGTLTVGGAATLQNAAGNNGGAIYANNGSVTVEKDATLQDNQATNGGAIYLHDGSLSIAAENNRITRNNATNGGALYVAGGTFEQTNSITDNSATNGGAVYVSGGTLTITGTVSGTAASGGAVFMTGGTVNVTGGTVSDSTAENGGAFYMEGGTLNMSGGTVGNTAQSSGGMLYATGGSVNITGGSITGNTATNGNGGAICYSGSSTVIVSGGTLSGNKANNGLGGAIYQSSGEITLSAGNINDRNTAKNGAAVYTAGGITNFKGVSITGNIASEGGAVGMALGTKLNFSGNTKVSDNTNTDGQKRNVYLNVDSDEIINVPENLGSNNIGVYVADNVRSTRGEACCSFGGYVSTGNLAKITDDRGIYTEYNYNNKLYWGKPVKFAVRYLPNGNGFPPNTSSGTQLLGETTYYPKTTENQIYPLVNLLYDTYYSDKIQTGYVYAYTYRNGESAFGKYITSIDWDEDARQWKYTLHDGTTYTNNNNARIIIYYADSAYISIVNNSGYDLTIDPLTVMGKTAVGDGYGYTAVINNVTQKTLLPITSNHLTIPKDCSVRLLFPGAKGSAWSLSGTFDAAEGSTIKYTLNRAGGGTEQTLPTTTTEGGLAFSLNGDLLSDAGGIYEILFGDPSPICKVENGGVEHTFTSLNLAKNYIVSSGLTTAAIEMLLDYQQPKTDILAVPEGYKITLTTAAAEGSAAAEGKTYTYVGDDPTRATISRSSGDMGSAVTSEIRSQSAVLTNDECDTSLTVDGIIFDGKALGQGGEGGAVKTANTIVSINNCDFKGYTATRGGAVFVKWGRLTVENSNFTDCKILSNQDKTGGGGIWTTAHDLTVRNCNFVNCDCTQYPKNNSVPQAGAIFHNIRYDGAPVYPNEGQVFPKGFSKNSTTKISGCSFINCIAVGSGGTIESDAWFVDIENCTFHGSQTTKSGGNGGAVNIYTNDNKDIDNYTYLNVINCWFEDCSATNGNTNGGAVRPICKNVQISGTTFKNTFSNNTGGAFSMTNTGNKLEIYGCTFDNCRANENSGAVYAKATTLIVGDSESYMAYNAETEEYEVVNGTRHTSFTDCTSKKFGGINHDQTGSVTVTNATFTRCTTTNEKAGALYTATKNLTITGTSFVNCSATSDGGAVYNNNGTTSQTITNCVFDGCSSGMSGGGAYLAATTITVSGGEVKNCHATNNGGGLYISPGGSGATFKDNYSFDNNWVTATDGKGGALFINQNTVTMTGGTVSNSKAAYGGGIYNKGTLTISKGAAENSGTITNCVARTSGGGIYTTGALTLNDAIVSYCYAVTSGGGMYQENGELKPYGTITHCYAPTGGGLYSKGGVLNITDTSKNMEISDCYATTVNIAEDGTPSATMEYSTDNKGGGIFRIVGSSAWNFNHPTATIKGCKAYDGGGVYLDGGPLTYSNGNFYGNMATNNGGAIYKNAGTVTMSGGVIGGSEENANRAQYGAAIFVADGQNITLSGGRITHNVAEVGGAVAVGGNNTNTQLLFQGAPVIRNNTNADGEKCNVYLNYDTNGIIRTTPNTALSAGAYIGVYVTDEQFDRHGNFGMPFGTWSKTDNLASFYNDRIYAGGLKGSSNSQIVWGKYVCKITDAGGNLLYTDLACEAPAVYMKLENGGTADTTSAFGMLSNSTVNLYNVNGRYSGAYQIQMLVGEYECTSQMKIANGSKDITLTTASRTPDDCGFCYTGTADQAVIRRGATYDSMINTDKMSKFTIENITIDGGSENGFKSSSNGGILFITNGTEVDLNENATLCNSELNKGFNGGCVRMQDGALSYLYINGGVIRNCVAKDDGKNTGYGGAISAKNGDITMNSGLITECTAEGGGGAVVVEKNMYMNGGTITGNNATKYGGGIELKGTIHFTGNPVVSGNTLNGSIPCNLQLMNDKNEYIYADGLEPFAEIRVYTDGDEKTPNWIYNKHGRNGDAFGTWTDDANLHCFINDRNVNLRGMKTSANKLIYWRENAFLSVGKAVESDWTEDKNKEFDFTVTLIKPDESGIYPFSGNYENMTFDNGVATFKLKAGEVRTAIGLPYDFIQLGVKYTVTETTQTAYYITQYSHNGGEAETGYSVSGYFGENMSDDPLTSSTASSVVFTNTRRTDDLTVSKTVTEGTTGDYTMPFTFTVTLGDNTITKTYSAKRYRDSSDTTGTDETIDFTNGVAAFWLTHGQALKILGLPTELGFKVEENLTEDQYANFRTYVTAGSGEMLSYSAKGNIGELKNVAFRNNRYGLVCKIVNDTVGREQLYYRADPTADPTPAIFDELEKAFETISKGIYFFTADGSAAFAKLRVEMVKPHYAMTRQATLAEGYNVTLGTAKKTDRLYPYPSDAEMPAVVTRDFAGGSMIVDNGNLTLDDIILDGARGTYTSTGNGGIVQVNGSQTLTVTNNATLRNSASSVDGGAIWISEKAGLTMNGTITNCEATNGGGVYASNGFGGMSESAGYLCVTIGGTISGCEAEAGNGGAVYAGTTEVPTGIPDAVPLKLTGSAALTGNEVVSEDGNTDSGCGGAIYSVADTKIDSENVTISGNTAQKDGGGIYIASDASLTMTGGTVRNNTATNGDGGAVWAKNISISGGTISGNKAENGNGGAIYTTTSSTVTIRGENTSITGNLAKRGGAVYDQAASFTMSAGSMTDNTASESGGAVYVAGNCSFTMSGGRITEGNKSPEGAVSTGSGAVLNFSGDAMVYGNTSDDDTTPMNVFLGYHSNTIINASNLTGAEQIGVYVVDGVDKIIYNNHGIANRPFGTGTGDNLSKFVNDRDVSLTGVQGPGSLIMWPGNGLEIQVSQFKVDAQGWIITPATPVGGAKFTLTNDSGVHVWSGDSNPSTGFFTVPWGISESESGDRATFTKQDGEGNVTDVSYILSEQQANQDTVRPAGTWKLTIAPDNAVTWEVIPYVAPADPEESQGGDGQGNPQGDDGQETPEEEQDPKVNRTKNVQGPSDPAYLGDVFVLYNDVEPTITFDPNGGTLYGRSDTSPRTDTIDFTVTELNHTYTIEEHNPTLENAVFRIWSTVKDPKEGDGHKEYKLGDKLLFYRHTDDDDLTLYALWETVVCKITDRENNLLYVNGSPAVYMSLKEGFDAFNEADFTLKDGTGSTPRKLKMLVGTYEMSETVELGRGKIMEFMTAPSTDTDGYAGPKETCVITRASTFDTGSMIIDNYNLVLRDITLDGAVKDSSNTVKTMDGDGGIVTVRGNSSQLTLAAGATLRNADVNGNGGAVYAYGHTIVNVSSGSITGCKAANGGAIYADNAVYEGGEPVSATVNISGGEITGNTAKATGEEAQASGGAVYATGTVNLSGGEVKNNKVETESALAYGGGLYLTANAELTMIGGSLSGNSAASGGGVYSDGSVTLSNANAVISGNTASQNGGGVYVSESGSLSITAGSVGASSSPNTAASGGGVYLAGTANLTGGSIAYNAASGSGGGLYLNTVEEITLNGTELSHNQAANGGAIYAFKPEGAAEDITLILAEGTVSNNSASANGGGVYLAAGVNLGMTGGTLNANTAQNGGGAYTASGSSMTLSGGTVSANTAKRSADDTTSNGAGVFVEGNSGDSYAALNVVNGSIIDNKADTFGGAVYLQGYGQLHVSGGTISTNSAGNANGGAINAEGTDARIYLSGSPTIFNNPGKAETTTQKNLVLSVDQNNIINTDKDGLKDKLTRGPDGMIGIYVIDGDDIYPEHGVYGKPFGTFGSSDDNRVNAKHLVNDRNLGLYGVEKGDNTIYWLDVVCKITDANDVMLYRRVNVDDSGVYVYVPAVYTSLADGFGAVSKKESLYRKSGSRYAGFDKGAVKIKMLKDYTLDESEIITYETTYETARDVTLTTAEIKAYNNDGYFYKPAQDGQITATLTRSQITAPMFTVNTAGYFNVTDLIIDGGSNTMMTEPNIIINGGAFNVQSVRSSTFNRVTLKNLNATGNGGAIYLNSGTLNLTNSSITNSIAAIDGGAVYADTRAVVTLTSGEINGNTATHGAGIYLTAGSTLNLSGNPSFGGPGVYADGSFDENVGNYSTISLAADSKNGEQAYNKARQDIYLEGTGSPLTSLVINGDLFDPADSTKDMPAGSIWVWAGSGEKEETNHYVMLKQFAVIADRVTVRESTYTAFRNARPDEDTDCGGDYLTGQSGEPIGGKKCVYWTGGFDFVFRKINEHGSSMDGATFTLYLTNDDGTIKLDDNGDPVPYRKSVNGTKTAVTATSRNIEEDHAVSIKTRGQGGAIVDREIYGDGLVAFEKVPPGLYYIRETKVVNSSGTDITSLYSTVEQQYRIVLDKKGWFTIDCPSPDENGNTILIPVPASTFLKGTDNKYTLANTSIGPEDETMEISTILNVPKTSRRVILRKVNDSFDPLSDCTFTIYHADKQSIVKIRANSGEIIDTLENKVSLASGALWIGNLPFGTYYLNETQASGTAVDKWFTLTVNENGAGFEQADGTIVNEIS